MFRDLFGFGYLSLYKDVQMHVFFCTLYFIVNISEIYCNYLVSKRLFLFFFNDEKTLFNAIGLRYLLIALMYENVLFLYVAGFNLNF